MNKKLSISVLTFLFLVSTTGLPVFSHYCELMGKQSTIECQGCTEEEEAETFSCCSLDEQDYLIELNAETSTCCVDEFDYKKIEDEFFQIILSNIIPVSTVISEFQLTTLNSRDEKNISQFTNHDLPTPKFGKQLLNTIHQLKLDLPRC